MNIDVNLDKLNENSKNIENEYLEDYTNSIENIEEILENIKTAWKGKDADNFNEKMVEFIVQMNSLKKHINTCSSFIKSYATIMQKIENAAQAKNIDLE